MPYGDPAYRRALARAIMKRKEMQMPVTIEPMLVNEDEKPAQPSVDLDSPVTFGQYSETLRLFHAEFIAIATEYGWDKPSAMLRRISLEFPERRNGKVQPAQIDPDLTERMFTPD